jgi:hypothetical protein
MHQEPQPPYQITALAVVIESSLSIAQEWPTPLFQYCMHLFKRINEAHHPAKVFGVIGLLAVKSHSKPSSGELS